MGALTLTNRPRMPRTLAAGWSRLAARLTRWERPPAAPAPLSRAARAAPATARDVALRRIAPGGVVLADGQHRALFEVGGMPLSSSSAAQAEAFLGELAGLLNAVRGRGVQMVARSRPAGFTQHLQERKAAALALPDPAARALGLAQVAHYERMAANGDARALAFYVVLPARGAGELERAAPKLVALFRQVGLVLRRVQEPELSLVLAEWWRGTLPTHWYYRLGDASISVARHAAAVKVRA